MVPLNLPGLEKQWQGYHRSDAGLSRELYIMKKLVHFRFYYETVIHPVLGCFHAAGADEQEPDG
jgi:hypothetical protein